MGRSETAERAKVDASHAGVRGRGAKGQAFERIRARIEAELLTPEDGERTIELRGELASMLDLCASAGMRNAPEAVAPGALQINLVAGTGFDHCRTRIPLPSLNGAPPNSSTSPRSLGADK